MQNVVQLKNVIKTYINVDVKINVSSKKIIVGILAHVFVRISVKSKYWKIIAATIVTQYNEIIIFMDSLSTKKVNTTAANVTSTASINWHSKKVRDYFILRTVLLVIILLLIITIIWCYYSKQKGII